AAAGIGLAIGALIRPTEFHLPPLEGVRANAELAPGPHRFGDVVGGTVDVTIARGAAQPGTVELVLDPFPYRLAGPASLRVFRDGGDALLRYTVRLECLDDFCLPGQKGDNLLLANGLVRYRDARGTPKRLLVGLPVVRVVPRSLPVGLSQWADGLRELERPHTALPAWLLGALLAIVTSVAAALSLILTRPWLGGAVAFLRRDRRSPLARAVAQVRRTARRDALDERRLALDGLWRALGDGATALRERAESLAWGREPPAPAAMQDVADEIQRSAR
ncbi:MAG: hypothetical protein ACKVUT_11010, partial [Gaiella sp.]